MSPRCWTGGPLLGPAYGWACAPAGAERGHDQLWRCHCFACRVGCSDQLDELLEELARFDDWADRPACALPYRDTAALLERWASGSRARREWWRFELGACWLDGGDEPTAAWCDELAAAHGGRS